MISVSLMTSAKFPWDLLVKKSQMRFLIQYVFSVTFGTGDKVWYVECETIILNPNQSNEVFQSTENVPSVLIWPSSAQRELGEINKWHLLKIAL